MRLVIAEGAGFLGSHMFVRLIKEGRDVVCVDSLTTSVSEKITHLSFNPSFQFILRDFTEPFFIDGPIVAGLHFTSPVSPTGYSRLPIRTLKVGGPARITY